MELQREQTVWGLSASDLHARFWASRGVQVVVPERAVELVPHAELFLLAEPRALALFRIARVLDTMSWLNPRVMNVRLRDPVELGYLEEVETDRAGRFVRFRRNYRGADHRVARVALTSDRGLALRWQSARSVREAREMLRRDVPRSRRFAVTLPGKAYNGADPEDTTRFLRDLVRYWKRPDATIDRIKRVREGVWADETARVDRGVTFVGPLWIGAGRSVPTGTAAVGPSLMWDRPDARPERGEVRWMELEALTPPPVGWKPQIPKFSKIAKRTFDIVFSLIALGCTLPLYPFVMVAILIEDGSPIFFAHTRETLGGREFGCVKFRSMRKDAEEIKKKLMAQNKADGPQFFMENDPRLTKVGKFLRKYQLDELPQFWNALRGDMSIVGPRPSPFKENQFSPEWREARLSVRPGITGLWQVNRTRKEGADFQEWIKYDLEYVRRQSLWFDLEIIYRTVMMIVRGFTDR